MLVKDYMSHRLEGIDGGDSLKAAAERMSALEIGSLLVLEAGRVVGIVTDRDIVVRAIARGVDASAPVRMAMSRGIVTCLAEEDVRAAASTMARAGVRRLIVLDRDLQPVGMLSVDHLALRGCAPELVASIVSRVTRDETEGRGAGP